MNAARFNRVRFTRRTAVKLAGGTAAGAVIAQKGYAPAVARQSGAAAQVYFGWVLGSTDIIAVALHADAPDANGARLVKAYVCDGLGFPNGIALWFKGTFTPGEPLHLTMPFGNDKLLIESLSPQLVSGSFTGGDNIARRFASFRAIDGAGIYDVTLDEQLRYSGTSTDGSTLSAQATEDGDVSGTITLSDGTEIPFSVHVLARQTPETLESHGLPPVFIDYSDVSIVPDSYTAVLSPGGAFWLGRSGDVRGGSAGNNIIGLDMNDLAD